MFHTDGPKGLFAAIGASGAIPDKDSSLVSAPINLSKSPLSNATLISCVTSATPNCTFFVDFPASVIAEVTASKTDFLR